MKEVVHLVNGVPTVSKVPNDWIMCSIFKEYRHPDEFKRDGKIVRTNCYESYIMPSAEMDDLQLINDSIVGSNEFQTLRQRLINEKFYKENSIPVEEMIEHLKNLPKGCRLVITQEGYYSEGKLANIFSPEYENIVEGIEYFSIGHSSQNY